MTTEEFNDVLSRRLQKIGEVLGTKAAEYAIGGDRMHNFRVAARIGGTTMRRALWGMATKHLVSVMDIVHADEPPTAERADEKIGDLINYLILLEAMCEHERQAGQQLGAGHSKPACIVCGGTATVGDIFCEACYGMAGGQKPEVSK